jgi:hypothetical protein
VDNSDEVWKLFPDLSTRWRRAVDRLWIE